MLLSLLVLRDHLPAIPAPREDRGSVPWRPVLFGLGAAVGFAVALGRSRKVEAPAATATAPSGEGGDGFHARSIHLPAPLKDSIEAELTADGPVLFSPPDAIDPVGTEALDVDADADEQVKGDG
ncbi:MAG: hypothetical protein QM589_15650 [Thermomicrobiales bacterium]